MPRMYDVVIAIDPGVNGAIACAIPGDPNSIKVVDCPRFSITKSGRKSAIPVSDAVGMAAALKEFMAMGERPFVVLEQVHARENDSKVSAFTFGENYGIWRGIIGVLGLPHTTIPPQRWKPTILGKAPSYSNPAEVKERSRKRCIELLPHLQEQLKYKKDHNRAEAALLALFAIKNIDALTGKAD